MENTVQTANALYVHGLGSGANTSTISQLIKIMPQYNWIAVEVAENPEKAIYCINQAVTQHKPQIVMGTSLGGYYVYYSNVLEAIKILCNPCMNCEVVIREKIGLGRHQYAVERQDGIKEFTLDESVCSNIATYRQTHHPIAGRANYALFSAHDELIGEVASMDNMAMVFQAGYTILIDPKGGHRLGRPALKLIKELLLKL